MQLRGLLFDWCGLTQPLKKPKRLTHSEKQESHFIDRNERYEDQT